MSHSDLCPECGVTLLKNVKRCSCGWRFLEALKTDYRCNYTLAHRRCPSIGTICPGARGKNRWYCLPHSQTLDNPIRAETALNDAEKNSKNLVAQSDWRQILLDEYLLKNKYRKSEK